MRDIESIRGDFFAHCVPVELLEEFEKAIREDASESAVCWAMCELGWNIGGFKERSLRSAVLGIGKNK
jgi:hypothetical protein